MDREYRYKAFISYSHADEAWASWLHRSLETYRVPRRLVGTVTAFGAVPARLAPVFRDREELASSTSLGDTLTRALEGSEFQVVICSPKAARSRWVDEEILTFKRLGREDRIFSLIVAGEPGASGNPAIADEECFPHALRFRMGPDGQLTTAPTEPIAADARPGKDGRRNALFKLIAGMLGVGLDALMQREQQRRHRRMAALATASMTGMVVTSGLAGAAWLARNEAERERARAEAEAETARQTTRFMVDLFKVSDPNEALGNRITAREILDKGAARIDKELAGQPVIQATLMDTMGRVYTSLGLYAPAVPLMRGALERRRTLARGDDPAVAETLTNLGSALTLTSDYDDAEQSLVEALAMRRRLLGPEHPDVAATLTALADVKTFTGKYDDARPLLEEALRIRRTAFGELDAGVAETVGDIGANYADQGQYEAAEKYLREAVTMRRRLHGDAHPELAEAISNLAWVLQSKGALPEAESLYREALAMKRRLLGESHPQLAVALNNLATVQRARGDLAGAEENYRRALDMNRRLLGSSHPEIAINLANTAVVVYARGDEAGAIAMLRESLAMVRRELGPVHPDVARRGTSLAFWLIEAGELDEAKDLIDESLAIRREALGPNHPMTASTLVVDAFWQLTSGRYELARETALLARGILAQSLPADHWQLAMAKSVEGAALAKLRDFPAAEKLLRDSVAHLSGAPIPGLARAAERRLADLYTAWGRPDEARAYRAQAESR